MERVRAPEGSRRLRAAFGIAVAIVVWAAVAFLAGAVLVTLGATFVPWPQVRAWAESAAVYAREEPPSVEECQRAAQIWRKYGQSILSARRAQACDDAYGALIK